MNDPTTTGICQPIQRREAPMVDTAIPRTGRVSKDGTGVSAVANLESGEGLAQCVEARSALTQKRLKELLEYSPQTGEFRWLKDRVNIKGGTVAGAKTPHGYRRIALDRKDYYLHRLAWLYVFGKFPSGVIDHINGIRDDNRLVNLREVTQAQNCQNRTQPAKSNKTGLLGVRVTHSQRLYRSGIQKNGKMFDLGYFRSAQAAHEAYVQAKRRIHECGTL